MMKNIYFNILLIISFLALFLHSLILLKVIPYEITWGGQLKNDQEMYVFETFSILVNLLYIYVVLQKAKYIRQFFNEKTISIILWLFFVIFVLNTIGNIFAKSSFEKFFTLITLANAILIWKINKKQIVSNKTL